MKVFVRLPTNVGQLVLHCELTRFTQASNATVQLYSIKSATALT